MASSSMGLRDEGRGLKGSGDPGIERDASVVLAGELLVSLLASCLNPCLEVRSYKRVDHVANVGSRHLPSLSHNGKSVDDFSVAHAEIQDEFHGEVVVLRDCDDFDVIVKNGLKS